MAARDSSQLSLRSLVASTSRKILLMTPSLGQYHEEELHERK